MRKSANDWVDKFKNLKETDIEIMRDLWESIEKDALLIKW